MATSEPTTGEIVGMLRYRAGLSAGYATANVAPETLTVAAERLESQERTIADKDAKIATLTEKIDALENDAINFDMNLTEMTARAEQAEKERDDAVVNINLCMNGDICKACVSWKNGICSRKDNRCDPKYRGVQQQNGEEK